ncbi:MAG: amino acid synthesis family protein [Hyphomicrobiales bacterium]|nr:MAG: amino acid synthesis family protein [Hyphomicrobiales bacterium]
MNVDVRKIALCVEETLHDGGPLLASPVRKGWAAAVVRNPYAGRFVEDIMPMMDALKPLGLDLSKRLAEALGGAGKVDAYGKGVIVGSAGEIEHSALWHVPGGYAMREILGRALAIVPSACKMGAIGASLDLPIHHKDACYVRSHFDAMTVVIADAPRADELVLAITMASGGRPHARAGGLKAGEISKMDGQR